MADVDVRIRATDQGSQNVKQFGDNLAKVGIAALGVTSGLAAARMGLDMLAGAAQAAWKTLEQGAALELAESRFENLAGSIGTTADALRDDLRDATGGMMSNAALIASASDIMSLGLAKTHEQTVRLASVVGQLGWDMQKVVLTMANNSKMRLDALGLSVEDVDRRTQALVETGMSLDDAFDLAVIEAGEAKLGLLGSAAETTAGKLKQMTAAVENAKDTFAQTFATELADNIDRMGDGTQALGDNMQYAAEGAAKLAAALVSPVIDAAVGAGQLAQIQDLRAEIEGMTDSIPELNAAWLTWLNATAPGTSIEDRAKAIEELQTQLANLQDQQLRDNPELRYRQWQQETEAIEETTDAVREFDSALAVAGARARTELGKIGEAAVDSRNGWQKSAEAVEMYGDAISSLSDLADAGFERQREQARELADAYRDAALEMTQTFVSALDPENMPDFGNVDEMRQTAFDLAAAYGLTIPVLGDIGVQLGVIDSKTAEAAAKAAIFESAFGSLLGQLQTGQIDTSEFIGAFDALIADLESKSLVEIQVELAAPKTSVDDMYWLPDAAKDAMRIPVEIDAKDQALRDALGIIDGIPDNDMKIITFDPEYEAVTDAIGEIESGINAIDGTVTFTPMADAVEAKINEIDGRHLTIYVDYVPTGTPEIDGRAAGGPVSSGIPYWVGEAGPELFVPWTSGTIVPNNRAAVGSGLNVEMTVNFHGPAQPDRVRKAIRAGLDEFYADLQREGVSW